MPKKKDTAELLSKTAMLSLLGSWGRIRNYRYNMMTTDHLDDVLFEGQIETSRNGIFHDVKWKREILGLGSFLCLNLIGRAQERLQVARSVKMVLTTIEVRRILSIQVDAIYIQPPKRENQKVINKFRAIRYKDLNDQVANPFSKKYNTPSKSEELVYKCNVTEPRFPGGILTVSPYIPPPIHTPLSWNIYREDLGGPDNFMEQILQQIREDKFYLHRQPRSWKDLDIGKSVQFTTGGWREGDLFGTNAL